MKKLVGLLITVMLVSFVFCEEVIINNQTKSVEVVSSNDEQTVISYDFGSFEKYRIEIDGNTFYRINLPGESYSADKGAPELPQITRSIIIPDFAKVEVEILEKEFVEFQIPVAPSKGRILRTTNPDDVPYTFSKTYQQDAFYPLTNGELRSPYIMRDFRGIVVTAQPFVYNPVTQTLRVYTHLKLAVNTVGVDNVNVKYRNDESYSKHFAGLYAGHFINFEDMRYDTIEEEGRIIVISYGSFMNAMQPYVDWKNQKGIQCDMYDVNDAEIGGSASGIQQFVQEQYNLDDGLTFVQLVGDAAQVPTLSSGGGGSDPSYAFIEGNDVYPELFVGRFSAENTSHVETQVERTVHYERDIVDGDWLSKGIGIGSDQGPGDDGETDDQHLDNIREKLLNFTYTEVDQYYDNNGGSVSACVASLNEGRGIINYTGHGSETAWGNGAPLSNSDVNGLTNDYMLPFINSVACVVGDFTGSTCFTEAWLRATNNSTGAPTGAIAHYGSSINQSWAPPMRGQDHAVDILVGWDYSNNVAIEQKSSIGGMYYNGACNMVDVHGDDGMMATWHIFGDASLQFRTDTPSAMNLSHTGTLFIGMDSYTVSTGVEDALVSLSLNSELFVSGYTDASGQITLVLDEPVTLPGEMDLTVSAFNKITAVEIVQVLAAEGPYVVVEGFSVDAGGDEVIEFGETVDVSLTLTNVGVDVATGVITSFNSDDSYISLADCAGDFGNIQPNQSVTVEAVCGFEVSNQVPNNHAFEIGVGIGSNENDWEGSMNFIAYAPVITFGTVGVTNDDDGNGRLDPGETADLVVPLINDGGAVANNIAAILSTTDEFLTINSSSDELASLGGGSTGNVTFNVTVSADAEIGHNVNFGVGITADNDYSTTGSFGLSIGLCLEDFETGTFVMYPWETDWQITEESYEGSFGVTSTNTGDETTSSLSVELSVTTEDEISFFYKVSSEENYDFLRFYIDGTQQAEWAGEIPWTQASYPVTFGTHTFTWEYYKDYSVSSGSDCAWIDYIVFPPIGPPPPPPELGVNPMMFDVAVPANSTDTESLFISNTGGQVLEYSLSLTETTPTRDMTGSYVECSAETFIPGETATWTFSHYNGSPDSEWTTDVYVTFPIGVTVLSSTNLDTEGGGGQEEYYDCNGNVITEEDLQYLGDGYCNEDNTLNLNCAEWGYDNGDCDSGSGDDSCVDNCGGAAETCFCDDVCEDYGDCCDDYWDECLGGRSFNSEPNIAKTRFEFLKKQNLVSSSNGHRGFLVTDGAVGNGVTIHWSDPDGGYGNIYPQETATATVTVTIDAGFAGDIVMDYQIDGDIWGNDPHTVYGDMTVVSEGEPLTWVTLNPTSGSVDEGVTNEIEVLFDTNELQFGSIHTANINISSNVGQTVVPVMLLVGEPGPQAELTVSVDELNEELGQDQNSVIDFEISNTGEAESTLSYEIAVSGVPEWLSVEPTSGDCANGASVTISASFNSDGLDTGTHTTDIFITSNGGFTTIPVSLVVSDCANVPDWSIFVPEFEFNMTLTGLLFIEGEESFDENDIVAAFVGDDVRGIASPSYFPLTGSYTVNLMIYSNASEGEAVSFKAYDSSECGLYENVTETVQFVANDIIGNDLVPFEFHASGSMVQNLDFIVGWNWFSLNIVSSDMAMNSVLASLGSDATFIKNQSGYANYYDDFGWYGLDTFEITSMYMIDVSTTSTLTVEGSPVDPLMEISLMEGWNWVSYLPQLTVDINFALESIEPNGTFIKNQTSYANYYDDFGWYGIEFMNPGDGYMLLMNTEDVLVYNIPVGLVKVDNNEETKELHWSVNPHQFEYNMAITAELEAGSQLAVFVDDEVRGVVESTYFPLTDSYTANLMVYGNDGEELSFRVYQEANDTELDILDHLTFEVNGIIGNDIEPVLLRTISLPEEYSLSQNYPNPFNPTTTINYELPTDANVTISVYNIMGQLVTELVSSGNMQDAGYHSVVWDGTNLSGEPVSSGVYIYSIQSNGFNYVKKMLLMK